MIDDTEPEIKKRHLLQMIVAGIVYVAVLVASVELLKTHQFSHVLRDLIAVTPAIPTVVWLWAIFRFVQSVDELQRQIHLEAFAISAGITCGLAVTYTFLEGVGLPHSEAWWAFDSLVLGWALAVPFVKKRYG